MSNLVEDHEVPLFIHTQALFPEEKVSIKITKSVMKKYKLAVNQMILVAYWLEKKRIRIEKKWLHPVASLVKVREINQLGDFFKVELQGVKRVQVYQVSGSPICPYASYQFLYESSDVLQSTHQIIKVKRELLLENLQRNQLKLPRTLQKLFDDNTYSYEHWMLHLARNLQLLAAEKMNIFQIIELEKLFISVQDLLSNFIVENSLKARFREESAEQFSYQRQKMLMMRRIQELKKSIRILEAMHKSEQKNKQRLEQEDFIKSARKITIVTTDPNAKLDELSLEQLLDRSLPSHINHDENQDSTPTQKDNPVSKRVNQQESTTKEVDPRQTNQVGQADQNEHLDQNHQTNQHKQSDQSHLGNGSSSQREPDTMPQVTKIEISPEEQARIDEILRQWDLLSEDDELEDDFEEDLDDSWDDEESKDNVEERIRALPLTSEAKAEVKRVLRQQNSGQLIGPELHNIRSFLEVVAELPWETRAQLKPFDLAALQADLDQEHYGLKDVKDRMIEFLAANTLSTDPMGTTLCLLGPPGVGKTSLVKVIARSLGRPFVRISLGGVQDEADIRGHRRTYVSATPGRICNALKKAKVKNPIILLDEVDKMASGVRGDPAAALLEVLDPEQNHAFRDHYLEIPLDLSEVLFICTANDARGMSPPLRDRLEMIELSGYTHDEKVQIAQKHLMNRQLVKHGLPNDALTLEQTALDEIILHYCKEAGVRQLERKIARICRKMSVATLKQRALNIQAGQSEAEQHEFFVQWKVKTTDLLAHLGAAPYKVDRHRKLPTRGQAYGLAWTAVGGSVLRIESACWKGKGHIKITGSIGDVMKESINTALSALRIQHQEQIETFLGKPLNEWDIHVHLPEGATPKDGPSAGITLYCALYSLLTGELLNPTIAMSGECSLQGQVLAVGGLKEKLLAAQQENMTAVILPQANQEVVMDFDPVIRGSLELHWVDTAQQALQIALQTPVSSVDQ